MTAEKILQSDLLDILFEHRNKSYGAYELRKQYDYRLRKAMAGVLALIALLGLTTLFGPNQNHEKFTPFTISDTLTLDPLSKPRPPAAIVKPKALPSPEDMATVKDNVPLIKPDIEVPVTEVPDNDKIDTSAYADKSIEGQPVKPDILVTQDPGKAAGDGKAELEIVAEEAKVPAEMHMLEQLPQYPGGTGALVRYMVNNLNAELEAGVKYIVKVQFIIDEEGRVSDPRILYSDNDNFNDQVLRAVKRMKTWTPGVQNGHNVAVRFVMPVTFVGAE